MAKRKPYTRYSLLKDLTWGVIVGAGLLIAVFVISRAIALKPLPPEVAQPPREVLACLDLKDRVDVGGGRTAPGGGSTSSTLARSLLDLRGVKDEWDLFRSLLKHNPRNQALAKFLALHERMTDKAFVKEFDEALKDKQTGNYCGALDRPLPEPARKWLRAHGELVRTIHDFCLTSGSLGVTDEVYYQLSRGSFNLMIGLGFDSKLYSQLVITLNVATRLALEEGRLPDAREYTLDLLRLMDRTDHLYPYNCGVFTARVSQWIETPGLPEGDWRSFREAMDRYAREYMTRKAYRAEAARSCLQFRSIWSYFDPAQLAKDATIWRHDYFDIGPLTFRRPSIVTSVANRFTGTLALSIKRVMVVHNLRRYDEALRSRFAYLDKPWPEARSLLAIEAKESHEGMFIPFLGDQLAAQLTRAAEMNLDRAAIDLMLEPDRPFAKRIEGVARDEQHPWRDPFTGQPLKVAETTTQTLIYSLGPDLEDQGGKERDKATNETLAPGDITIRIPKERFKIGAGENAR